MAKKLIIGSNEVIVPEKSDISSQIQAELENLNDYVLKADIVNNVTSTDADKPLSANQGKVLKDLADTKANDNAVVNLSGNQTITGTKNFIGTLQYNDEEVATIQDLSTVFKYKGSVDTYGDLPTTNRQVGDVWNVEDTGKNFAWDGTNWDDLGGIADLSNYYTKTQADSLLNAKVTSNTAITGATKTKITYDSKGLVTAGADLSASDIPNLNASKITAGTFSDARIASASTWNAKVGEAPTDGKAYVRVNGVWVADIITNIGTFSDASYIMEHLIVNNLPTGIYKANVSAFGGFEVIINYQRTLTTAKGTVQSFDSLTVVDIDLSGGLPVIVRNDQFNINAETLPYDRSGSGLLATNVQDAIDELDGKKLGKSSSNSGTFAYIRHHTTDEMRELTSSPVADKIPLFKSNALFRTLSGNTASRPSTVLHAGDQYFNTDNNQMEVYIGDANHWLNQVYKNGDTIPTPASGTSHTYHVISDGTVLGGTKTIEIDGETVYDGGTTTTGTTLIVTNNGGVIYLLNMDNTQGQPTVNNLTLSATNLALKRVA